MNREEVLSRSRIENKDQDEMMVDTLKKAGKTSSEVALIITAVIFAIEAFMFNSFNFALLGVYFSLEASKDLVKYRTLKDKRNLVKGLSLCLLSILFLVAHLVRLTNR